MDKSKNASDKSPKDSKEGQYKVYPPPQKLNKDQNLSYPDNWYDEFVLWNSGG